MAKYVCTVCGYVYEGDAAPEFCPVCKAPAEKFKLQEGEKVWAAEHVVGVAHRQMMFKGDWGCFPNKQICEDCTEGKIEKMSEPVQVYTACQFVRL